MDLTNLSRVVSHALRHEPWVYELELDSEGWVPIDLLIAALQEQNKNWKGLSAQNLQQMISNSDKQRHEITDQKIRALYGHSLPGKLNKIESTPPKVLFHGTSPEVIELIKLDGLKPMKRQYVHLSTNQEIAYQVGKRKTSNPIILTIQSLKAYADGVKFYQGNELVWLADLVPAAYIQIL